MDCYELRRLDYSLTEDHEALQAAYRDFFKTHCSIETVRAAEESGFDKTLWERSCAMGATTMALPQSVGGDGATLVDLTLVAEEIGRSLAPVPWIDHVCAARLLARLGALEADVVNGKQLAAFDPQHDNVSGVRLIPTGSIADQIVVRDGPESQDIVRLTFGTRPVKVDNIGRLPMAWVDPASADDRTVLASGTRALAEYQRALDEWRVLTAAALVGLVEETMTIAADFAKTRYTLGVPISTLQGISHPLANIAIIVQGGRNLARRAAWFLDNEPEERPELAPSAFVFMAEEASKAATMCACPGRPGCFCGGGGYGLSGPRPRVDAGRRRPRCQCQVHRRARRGPRKWFRKRRISGFLPGSAVRRRPGLPRRGARLPAHACHRRRDSA